jgi:hypothetical protein
MVSALVLHCIFIFIFMFMFIHSTVNPVLSFSFKSRFEFLTFLTSKLRRTICKNAQPCDDNTNDHCYDTADSFD